MADPHYIFRKGIFDRLVTSSSFRTALAQVVSTTTYYKVYHDQAPQKVQGTTALVTLPYAVFNIGSVIPGQDSGSKWYTATVQVVISAETIAACETIAGYLYTLLEDSESALSFTGFTVTSIMRGNEVNVGRVDGVENLAVQYTITIQ